MASRVDCNLSVLLRLKLPEAKPALRKATKKPVKNCRTSNSKTEGEEADEFLGSGFGGFVSKLTEFAANSPINQGKIALVKAQAGDYDVAATQAQLQGIIDEDKVVMFSFTT